MVNEINRPSSSTMEDEALRVRMETSNRNIQSMQQEHQELLREMERLRRRAAELALSSTQQGINTSNEPPIIDQQQIVVVEENNTEVADTSQSLNVSQNLTTERVLHSETETERVNEVSNDTEERDKSSNSTTADAETEDDPETAEYLRQKIAEIAAMKAQYQRVQHMVNTTNLIEQHIANNPLENVTGTSTDEVVGTVEPAEIESDRTTLNMSHSATTGSSANSAQENEELLTTMLSMFNEFTTDLRDQATTLRAERDRLRALKEEILRRRHQS